ncbi:MAG: hypothetical protein EHM58_04555 [Ignavibacteriae bacterium]|nr:MAG: hypothetical protein EHM58_04555 [Ignavibacteriota bacterium]
MDPKIINILTNVIAAILFVGPILKNYFESQTFDWFTFGVCFFGAIVAYFTGKSGTNILKANPELKSKETNIYL